MNHSVHSITLFHLGIALIPVAVVIAILFYWSLEIKNTLYAISRMLVQLLLIGYVLAYIFQAEHAAVILLVLIVMVMASSWIALGTVAENRWQLLPQVLFAIAVGGGITLLVITQGVLSLSPWYLPQYVIPLSGMIFANAMNSVSLAAERIHAEMERGESYSNSRNIALHAALIPITNSLFAVGVVSIPGMMTGQILSGVDPFIAARYQIMVMCMVFASAGLSSALFLALSKSFWLAIYQRKRGEKYE